VHSLSAILAIADRHPWNRVDNNKTFTTALMLQRLCGISMPKTVRNRTAEGAQIPDSI
jgi:hypothetical protein